MVVRLLRWSCTFFCSLVLSATQVLAADNVTGGVPAVADLLSGLKARLEQNPNDRDGWVLLGKSYHYLGNYEESKAAYQRAKALGYEMPVVNMPDKGGKPAFQGLPGNTRPNRQLLNQLNSDPMLKEMRRTLAQPSTDSGR